MAISSAIDLLGAAGNDVQPIFITVDPQRDTVEHLRDYVSSFHPRLIGLTGSQHAIRKLAVAYKVYYATTTSSPIGSGARSRFAQLTRAGLDPSLSPYSRQTSRPPGG
jgi:cytochrome oxidase Cu insertion factor (SCO1/SenC/PrrC family)